MPKVVQIASAKGLAPGHLGEHGRALWLAVMADHQIDDGAGRALLARACEAMDRLRQVQAQIAADGLTTKGYKGQVKAHPLLQVEAEQGRAMMAAFRGLNLDLDA